MFEAYERLVYENGFREGFDVSLVCVDVEVLEEIFRAEGEVKAAL